MPAHSEDRRLLGVSPLFTSVCATNVLLTWPMYVDRESDDYFTLSKGIFYAETLARTSPPPRGTLKLKHIFISMELQSRDCGTLTEVGSSGAELTQVLAYEKRPEVKLEKGRRGHLSSPRLH